jgi:hypothetical protein
MAAFKFDLKQLVNLVESRECGVVIGRAEYSNSGNSYLVRYRGADGVQNESWWSEDALDAA